MIDLASMKYAELRKLAKSAGIKANQKQEKLVAELTKYFEQQETSNSKNEKQDKTPKSTPKADPKVSSAKKPGTPLVNKKIGTPSNKTNTPVRTNTPSKINTPNNKSKPSDKANTSLNKANTPINKTAKANTSNKIGTPINKSNSPSNKTAKINTPIKVGSPNNKINTPKSTPGASTVTNNVKKVENPGSSRSASRWEKKVFSPAKVATKRKQTDTPEQAQPAKKRRSTFEKAPTPDLKKPEIETNSTEKRRSGRVSSSSPVVKEMLGAMKSDMNDEEMKSSLLSILDKNVQEKVKAAPTSSTSIPRFAAFVKNRQAAKPVTPGNKNWDKIHKKNFDKFDSIDVYLEKKRKRAEDMSASAKKAKTLLSEVQTAVNKLKSHKTPTLDENKFVKPRTSASNKTTPFKPTVLNTSKLNLNFGARPTPKTLPRKSPKTLTDSNVNKPTETRKSTSAVLNSKSAATPFKFTAVNSSLNGSVTSTKKTFDIKASLARPITWKPHKGKLKPLTSESKSPVYVKTNSAVKATKTAKERVNTRVNVANRRADMKNKAQMARRGINV